MELTVTIDDPKAYSRSWVSDTIRFLLQPDTELLEHLCENNRDAGLCRRSGREVSGLFQVTRCMGRRSEGSTLSMAIASPASVASRVMPAA